MRASLALCLLSASVAGCGSSVTKTPIVVPVPVSPILPVSPMSAAKAPIHGLVAMGQENFNTNPALTPDNTLAEPNANPDVYAASVILVTWKQLQPTSGLLLDTSAIDAALSAITAYNAVHTAHPMVGKLRVFAGINTPLWAQNLDGTPVSLPGTAFPGPRFWTLNYVAAWKNLQTLLAAKYDTDPLLREVAVSGCSSLTAEPFVHPSGVANIPTLKAAGFTDAQFENCLSTMADQYSAWANTPLDYTFNQFIHIDTGSDVADSAYTISLMAAWRTALGATRGILANHGLQPTLTPAAAAIYPEFTMLGPPLALQSYGPGVDWNATIALGLTYHPSEIEIWTTTQAGGYATISLSQLQLWAGEI